VDDLIEGSEESEVGVFIDQLHRKITMGTLSYFLEMHIEQRKDGIFVFQRFYTERVVQRFKMREANAVATHFDRSSGGIEDSFGSHVAYCEAVGCPLYLGTRPDIVFAVSRAA
jgi:hypothetical protein